MGDWLNRIKFLWLKTSSLDGCLLTKRQFERELARERLRSARRQHAFCVLSIRLLESSANHASLRTLIRLVMRSVRRTDHKGRLENFSVGILLVDTAEMGGRLVLDRLEDVLASLGLRAELHLRVYDPERFDRNDPHPPTRWEGALQRALLDDAAEHSRRLVAALDPMLPRSASLSQALKRGVDVIGATVGLLVAAPLIGILAVIICRTSKGPALFRQQREGRYGQTFTIYKLRTMVVDAEQQIDALRDQSEREGPAFKMQNDPRVTKLGKFLRSTCLDELPQLWNVLRGEMSLVGPRPLPVVESRSCQSWHRRRLDIRPGLTCVWQVNKRRAVTFDDWMRMDLSYLDHRSLWQDFTLLARTLTVPLSRRGGE